MEPINVSQIAKFRQDGYLVVKGMATPQACATILAVVQAHLRDQVAPVEYEAEVGYSGAPPSLDAPGGRTVRRLRAAYKRDPVFRFWAVIPPEIKRS